MEINHFQLATLIDSGATIEEEAKIYIKDHEIVGFVNYCDSALINGTCYKVKLHLTIFDNYIISEANDEESDAILRIGNNYAYQITGKLNDGKLHSCGIIFDNDAFETEYTYLEGNMVKIDVDRLDIELTKNI
jgi:hypothetical protein